MQTLWLQTAFIFLEGALLVGALITARRGRVAPLVVFGALVLLTRGLGSVGSYLAIEEGASPVMQVLILYARILPNTVLLVYVCAMQAHRYRAARNNDLVRVWFRRALYVHGAAYLVSFAGDLFFAVPLLEGTKSIPVAAFLFEAPGYALGIVYGSTASVVFIWAARGSSGPPRLRQRLQNLFWGVSMAGFSVTLSLAASRQAVRAFYPEAMTEELLGALSRAELAPFAAYAGGIVAGSFAYYTQSGRSRYVERLLGFLELVGDLVEELANAAVYRGRLAVPYATMMEAAGAEFRDLSASDMRRADNAFRARTVWEQRADERGDGRICRRRMADLARAYEDELKEPVLAGGLREELDEGKMPDTLRDLVSGAGGARPELSDAVALALESEDDGGLGKAVVPEWGQLVYLALADSGLLSEEKARAALDGRGLSEEVLASYRLARYKVERVGGGASR